CILSLSSLDDTEKNVYKHRDNSGQSLINLTLAAYEAEVGTFEGGVKAFGKRVGCRGNVFTVTRNRSRLRAQLHDGSWLECEHDIDTFKNDCDDPFRDVDLVAHDGKRLMSNKKVLSA